jgi:hypothetical protein
VRNEYPDHVTGVCLDLGMFDELVIYCGSLNDQIGCKLVGC